MDFGTGARMRAARHLAGFSSVEALAAEIRRRGTKKLGTTTLRKIEQEQTHGDYRQLSEIAEACGLDVAWFTADLARLAEISDDPRSVIARELAAAAARAAARRKESDEGHRPPHEEAQ